MSKRQGKGKLNFPLVIFVFTVLYLLSGIGFAVIGTYAMVLLNEYYWGSSYNSSKDKGIPFGFWD